MNNPSAMKGYVVFILFIQVFNIHATSFDQQVKAKFNIDNDCYKKHNKSGVIQSLNYGNNHYDNSKTCGWVIESPEPKADIEITFQEFKIETSKRCLEYDYVFFKKQEDGANPDQWEDVMNKEGYCGEQKDLKILEKTKRILIIFLADSSINDKGFMANFSIKVTNNPPQIMCIGDVNGINVTEDCSRKKTNIGAQFNVKTQEKAIITIQCFVDATPPADTYVWTKQVVKGNQTVEVQLTEQDRFVKNIFPNGSIQFHQLERSDTGVYFCNASNRNAQDIESFNLTVNERCVCPKTLETRWYDYPPYTLFRENQKKKGIFYTIITDMIREVCGNCSGGHGTTEIKWREQKNKRTGTEKRALKNVKDEIEKEPEDYDLFFPIPGAKTETKYRNMFYFLPMVDTPGVAFLIVGDEPGAAAAAIFDSILQGWPVLVLTIVFAALSGIIMWILDTYWNPDQFPRSFGAGTVEGFWWAFVTMTTVGYGDIAPVGVPGRSFAVIWILTGLVIIAIFTGVITTSLTVIAMTSEVKLYGATVAAINNSAEFRLGVVKNANMLNYSGYLAIEKAMDARLVNGSLIDAYVAGYHKDKFSKFRVNNIFESTKSFGVVFGKRLAQQALYDKFTAYVETNKARITKFIENNTNTLEAASESAASEKAKGLFDPESPLFKNALTGCLVLLVIFTAMGLLFEYAYLRPRQRMIEAAKNLEMIESRDIKELAASTKLLKETLLFEVSEFYRRWSEQLVFLRDKHKQEQKTILKTGETDGPMPARLRLPVSYDNEKANDEKSEPPGFSGSSTPSSGSTKSLVKNNNFVQE